jgi:hypothetical protein
MGKKLKQVNKRLLKGLNLKRFSLFLVAAFVLLMLSKLSEPSLEYISFEIEVDGLPKDVQLRSDSNLVIQARIKSTGFGFLPMTFRPRQSIKLNAEQDLKKLKGNRYLWVLGTAYENLNLHLSDAFEVVSASPDSVYFEFDMLQSKKVEIEPKLELSYASGYDLSGDILVSEDSIVLVGPSSALDSIFSLKTEALVLKDLKSDFNEIVQLINPNPAEIALGRSAVSISGRVTRFTEGEITVPIEIVNVPPNVNLNYFPKEVTVNYYLSLDDFSKVSSEDFEVICDFREYEKTGTGFLTPQLTVKSELVKSARMNGSKVDFIFL